MMQRHGLYVAWVIALFGALLSLYIGEVLGFLPCRLCWIQRVALFPLAIQLGIAAYLSDAGVKKYAYPLIAVGLIAAVVQILLPWLSWHAACGAGLDCGSEIITIFRVPFPWLSLAGFLAIAACLYRSPN